MRRILAVLSSSILALTTLALTSPAQAADVVATVTVGAFPTDTAFSPDGRNAYITSETGDNVSVLSLESNTVTATIPVGNSPRDVVVTDDGVRAYVANRLDNTVSVINTATNSVVSSIPVAGGPAGLALSPDGSTLYVTSLAANTVTPVDTATLTPGTATAVGVSPLSIAVSGDGAYAFVVNNGANTVSVLALPALSVVATVPVGAQPYAVVTDGSGASRRAFVTNSAVGSNSVMEVSSLGGAWSVSRTIPVPGRPVGIDLSADRATLYVSQYTAGSLAVVAKSTGAITSTTALTPDVAGVTVSRDGSRMVVLRLAGAPTTATVFSLVPRVALDPAEDVKGKTATGVASVTTDAGGASGIRCVYSRELADVADPYTSTASSVKGSPATVGANRTAEVTCDFEDLKRGREYFYTVVASDSDGIGAATTTESFTTRPPKPDDPKVTRKNKKLILRWDEVRAAEYYKARIRKGGSYKNWRTLDQPKVVFKNLKRKTSYKMQIRAGNESGVGPKLTLTRKTR